MGCECGNSKKDLEILFIVFSISHHANLAGRLEEIDEKRERERLGETEGER